MHRDVMLREDMVGLIDRNTLILTNSCADNMEALHHMMSSIGSNYRRAYNTVTSPLEYLNPYNWFLGKK